MGRFFRRLLNFLRGRKSPELNEFQYSLLRLSVLVTEALDELEDLKQRNATDDEIKAARATLIARVRAASPPKLPELDSEQEMEAYLVRVQDRFERNLIVR